MQGMVEIPAKAGASTPYSCLSVGREGGIKALPFQTGFTSPYCRLPGPSDRISSPANQSRNEGALRVDLPN
jgi:hypothetical protein